jgi:hypothetical protein
MLISNGKDFAVNYFQAALLQAFGVVILGDVPIGISLEVVFQAVDAPRMLLR